MVFDLLSPSPIYYRKPFPISTNYKAIQTMLQTDSWSAYAQPHRSRLSAPSSCPATRKQAIPFGALYKISGSRAIHQENGQTTFAAATALNRADLYEQNPDSFNLGYYREPHKPFDVWVALDDAYDYDKSDLDKARAKSVDSFNKLFRNLIEQRGVSNASITLSDSWSSSRFAKVDNTPKGSGYKLENAQQWADYYDACPSECNLGYFRDPEKPGNIWIADGDAREILDRVKTTKPELFSALFKLLKAVDGKRKG